MNFQFNAQMLKSLIGGLHVMEIERLNIQNLEQAYEFIRSYGYDLNRDADKTKLWSYHRRAVTYIRERLMVEGETFPDSLSDPNQLKDLAYLLIYASTHDQRPQSLQRWSCAILKVMHVLVHLDNDLFTSFSQDIQDQILKPVQSHIHSDAVTGTTLGSPKDPEHINLKRFDIKPFKTSDSSITKLLAKPEEVAFTVLDKIGVRFVTRHLFDVFRVMRYLVDKNLVSHPHNIPDQSNNTLFPLNLFLEVMESFHYGREVTAEEIDKQLYKKLKQSEERAEFRHKLNQFSSRDYRFIKFISRHMVKIETTQNERSKHLSFFYPFEIQIVDYQTFLKNLSGPASHERYKKRQIRRARARVLGLTGDEKSNEEDQGKIES